MHGLLENWFIPILSNYYKRYQRNVTIKVLAPHELKDGLGEGHFDVIFTTENIQSELITSLKLFDELIVLISRHEIDMSNLSNERWIVYNDQDNIFKLGGTLSKSIITVDSITAIINLVKNGVGVAAVPAHMLKKTDKFFSYELQPLNDSHIYMATLNYKIMPTHIKEMTLLIRNEVNEG